MDMLLIVKPVTIKILSVEMVVLETAKLSNRTSLVQLKFTTTSPKSLPKQLAALSVMTEK